MKTHLKFIPQTPVIPFSLACFTENRVKIYELTLNLENFHQILFDLVKFVLHCLS